jgi:transposase
LALERRLGGERVWALEDCRQASGSVERFLIARGERVLRVPTTLMAATRRGVATARSFRDVRAKMARSR